MAVDVTARLRALDALSGDDHVAALATLVQEAGASALSAARDHLVERLLRAIRSGDGAGRDRMVLGDALGDLGDPRLRRPTDADYWVRIPSDMGDVVIGKFPVTNDEYRAWVDAGGYEDRAAWSDEGWAWLQKTTDPWPVGAKADEERSFTRANQPVVGVTFFEAEAYAAAHGARLVRTDERVWVVRGEERRPYPWGSPFGEGNANTREEVMGRPCAVGLFIRDQTPEGVCDLAANVAEWTGDDGVEHADYSEGSDGAPVEVNRVIHPGAWDQPSMAAWAKALALKPPASRWTGLGFRLGRDAS